MINIDVHGIKIARNGGYFGCDIVTISGADLSTVKLYFPAGKGQAVADAINAAIAPASFMAVDAAEPADAEVV